MNLEDLLRKTLERPEPPPGFAERVVACLAHDRAAKTERSSFTWWNGSPAGRWSLALVAALLLIATIAGLYTTHHRLTEGKRAKAQVLTALEIAREKLQVVRQTVRAHGGGDDERKEERQ